LIIPASRIHSAAIIWTLLLVPQIAMAYNYGEGGYSSRNYGGIQPLAVPAPGGVSVTGAIIWGIVAIVLIFLGGLAILWIMRKQQQRVLERKDSVPPSPYSLDAATVSVNPSPQDPPSAPGSQPQP
jgi:hypothetical protein